MTAQVISHETDKLTQYLHEIAPHFIQFRHRIHSCPELGFEEEQTATLIAHELQAMGLAVMTGVGGTGVVAVIDSGKPGKTVALRAEMDALPIAEQTGLAYQSRNPGKMHACGHDGHTATLLAAAKALCANKDQFRGKIKLIFQPAEESGQCGAREMEAAGVLENPTVDAIFAYHNYPGVAEGIVLTRFGCALSRNTYFTITIQGKGGHAAMPEYVVDPILVGAMIAQAFPVLSQQLSTTAEPLMMRVTEFNSGVGRNVVPDRAVLVATLRAPRIELRDTAIARIETMVHQIAQAHGAQADIHIVSPCPPTINTALETEHVFATARKVLGENRVQEKLFPARASEDFVFYVEKVPGCYFFIGNGVNSASCHNSSYDFNDSILPVAARLLCAVAMDYLNVSIQFV